LYRQDALSQQIHQKPESPKKYRTIVSHHI